jgi:hypothetical protein
MKAGRRVSGYAGKQEHTVATFSLMVLTGPAASTLTVLAPYPLTILPADPRIIF